MCKLVMTEVYTTGGVGDTKIQEGLTRLTRLTRRT